ncbi:RHS repeat-associated core domain-containing protein [Pseudomonas viridiflava]|uniref:RHS repeat-associated core domain-containing protein n=1 Tax=Pseudomonas viridiflava TaxID=33069 RepID=UPI000F02225C|nr:RHS repeat-associated core domain-containing protein [Pseudomonas viridiflava]
MSGITETAHVLCRYRHDALDRLAIVDPGAQESVLRFYQKSRLTVEIQGAVRRRIFQSGDHLLAEHSMEGSAARVDMLGTDVQRSVLHAVTAHERQSLVYSPYGHRLQGDSVSGFNGERADPVTGHYPLGNGYRAFNPVLMCFNQPDTLSPFGRGGLNAYAYCLGDPVNRIDPSGRSPAIFSLAHFPDEILEQVFKHLQGKDLVNMSRTSSRMAGVASGLPIPTVDTESLLALQTIKGELSGEALGVLPSALKRNDPYRAGFELAALNIKEDRSRLIKNAQRIKQSMRDRVAGRNASYSAFEAQVRRDRRRYSDNALVLQGFDRTMSRYHEMDRFENRLIHETADFEGLENNIRRNFDSR